MRLGVSVSFFATRLHTGAALKGARCRPRPVLVRPPNHQLALRSFAWKGAVSRPPSRQIEPLSDQR